MTTEGIEKYKKKLEKERLLLLGELKETEKPTDFGDDVDHFEEETEEGEAASNQAAVGSTLKSRLDEIDVALSKFQTGKYGICEMCGREIEPAILDIDPESRFCKSCKLSQ